MAGGLKAILNGQSVYLEVTNTKLLVKTEVETRTIPLSDIRSLHVKSNEERLLKITLPEDSLVLEFENYHTRDVAKSVLLASIKTEQEVLKRILESDSSIRALYNNVKLHLSPQAFWTANKHRVKQLSPMVRQQPAKEINMDTKDFISMLPPALLKIFSEMNCSITQFYNLLNQSFFLNARNEQNSVDRMICDALRNYAVRQDYATRINSYSMLALRPIEEAHPTGIPRQSRAVEFEPVYPFEHTETKRARRKFVFEIAPLTCNLRVEEVASRERITFEKKDLVWIRDLSRVVYKSLREGESEVAKEAKDITARFCKDIGEKYGEGSIAYIRRLVPTFFIS
jgi:hypothetical protein